MISQDQVIKESCDILVRDILVSYHPTKFGAYMDCGSKDKMFLNCHVIPQDRVTQKPYDFLGMIPLR